MKRSTRVALLLVLFAALGAGYRACTDEPEPPELDEGLPVEVSVRPRLAPVAALDIDASIDAGLDAGTNTPGDAGASSAPMRPVLPDADAYMAQWLAALKPLLHQYPPKVKFFRARSTDGGVWPPARPSIDAGVRCEPGVATLGLQHSQFVDVVVFIDTSGSMFGSFETVAWWLGQLQARLGQEDLDAQLVLVADTRYLRTKRKSFPRDASVVDQTIESHDIFDILLKTGWAPDGWRAGLRAQVPTELVLVTDDSPLVRTPDDYERRFVELVGLGADTTRLHFVGGFEPFLSKTLLGPTDSISTQTCSNGGVAPGEVYQALTTRHLGFRASICKRESLSALVEQLVKVPAPLLCNWTPALPPGALPERLRAVNRYGQAEWLVPEFNGGACVSTSTRRGYFTAGEEFILCPTTCDSLQRENFQRLELPYLCR